MGPGCRLPFRRPQQGDTAGEAPREGGPHHEAEAFHASVWGSCRSRLEICPHGHNDILGIYTRRDGNTSNAFSGPTEVVNLLGPREGANRSDSSPSRSSPPYLFAARRMGGGGLSPFPPFAE